MTYQIKSNSNPLVAAYHSSAASYSGSSNYIKDLPLNTSLYSGTVSSNTLTIENNSTLRGDFYGSISVTGALSVNLMFLIDGVEQTQSRDHNADTSYNGHNSDSPEVFFADPDKNTSIKVRYRRYAGGSGLAVVKDAYFPRITGILIP